MKFVSSSGVNFDFSVFNVKLGSVAGINFNFSIFKVKSVSGALLIVGFSAVFKVSKGVVFETYI